MTEVIDLSSLDDEARRLEGEAIPPTSTTYRNGHGTQSTLRPCA